MVVPSAQSKNELHFMYSSFFVTGSNAAGNSIAQPVTAVHFYLKSRSYDLIQP